MLAPATEPSAIKSTDDVQEMFLAVLPSIEVHANFCFRARPHCCREELIAEVVAYAWHWFSRLMQRGKDPTQFLTTFTRYAILAVQNGRSIGRPYSRKELWNAAARTPDLHVHSLDNRSTREQTAWSDLLVEKRAFSPPEVAAMRLDFAAWRESLPARSRRVADLLASGERACVVAQKVQVSRARITQLRRELAASWKEFQGEVDRVQGLECAVA